MASLGSPRGKAPAGRIVPPWAKCPAAIFSISPEPSRQLLSFAGSERPCWPRAGSRALAVCERQAPHPLDGGRLGGRPSGTPPSEGVLSRSSIAPCSLRPWSRVTRALERRDALRRTDLRSRDRRCRQTERLEPTLRPSLPGVRAAAPSGPGPNDCLLPSDRSGFNGRHAAAPRAGPVGCRFFGVRVRRRCGRPKGGQANLRRAPTGRVRRDDRQNDVAPNANDGRTRSSRFGEACGAPVPAFFCVAAALGRPRSPVFPARLRQCLT